MKQFQRVNKKQARKFYDDGTTVYILPCKVRFGNMFITPFDANLKDREERYGKDEDLSFDRLVREFEWYNCCYELGYYATYYVKE